MMSGQINEQAGDLEGARDMYSKGLKHCPTAIPLWILAAKLEQRDG